MKIELAGRTDQGPRPYNDDRILLLDEILNGTGDFCESDLPVTAALCDGCGGYAGGGTAAELVLSSIRSRRDEMINGDCDEILRVLQTAEDAVREQKRSNPSLSDMCTTLVGCVFTETVTVFFYSGDSRVYSYDGSSLVRMTKDHSLVQELVDLGELSEDEALHHPRRNVITRCLGIGASAPEVYRLGRSIRPGEIFLLCSDGLWEYVSEEKVREILDRKTGLLEKADLLVNTALLSGGDDNTSVLLCRCPEDSAAVKPVPFILD